jgi:hypothetical protein
MGPPAGGASHWRDAIELELTKVCLQRGDFSTCPADIIFHEIVQLLTRDPGGRGVSIAALYLRLRFGGMEDSQNQGKQLEEDEQIAELGSIPECIPWAPLS